MNNKKTRDMNRKIQSFFNSTEFYILKIMDRNTSYTPLINSILNFYKIDHLPNNYYDTFYYYNNNFYIYYYQDSNSIRVGININDYEKIREYDPFIAATFEQQLLENIIIGDN